MSKKRRRDPGTIDIQLVEIYEDLSNQSEEIRLKAAHALLDKLAAENALSNEKFTEVLTRLVRGLCSGRKAARLGFSIAFTEFLVQHLGGNGQHGSDRLGFAEVFDVLIKQTDIGGNVFGQEERDHQLGRLFGAEAMIKSAVLFSEDLMNDAWSQVLGLIFELALKKAWLREECGWVLYKSIQTLKAQTHGSQYAQVLVDKLAAIGLAKTPEGVAVWLGIQSTFRSTRLPASVWPHNSPLHRKAKVTLSRILKELTAARPLQAEANSKIAQNSTWSPNLHFAWDIVLTAILQLDAVNQVDSSQLITFEDFWTEAVDNGLFSASASDQRKYWGFVLFQHAIHKAPVNLISLMFSKNFIRCFMNQLASSDRNLHRNAEKAVKSIHSRVETDPSVAPMVLDCLLKPPNGRVNFDQITKTKTVEKLLVQVKDHDLEYLLQCYTTIISNPNAEDDKAASVERQIIADRLLTVVRSQQTFTDSGSAFFTKDVLNLFAQYAYFDHEQIPSLDKVSLSPPISDTTRSMLRSRILSCLTHVLAKSAESGTFVYSLIDFIRSQSQGKNELRPIFEADGIVTKSIDKGWTVLQKVHSKAASTQGSRKRFLGAFELLYALVLLQVYNGDADAVSMVDDLKSCYDKLIKHKSRSEQAGFDGLVEILLGFVAKPSSLFRRLASQVFSTCTSDISESGLQSMIKVLETNESVAGQAQLFDREDVDNEIDDASDVEVTSIGSTDDADDASDSPSAQDTDTNESDHDSAAAAEELAAFDAKLASALKTRPATDDLIADGDDEPSDEDMNDEQMEALDEQLQKVFRERKNVGSKKLQNKDAREAIVNFKSRVLELLEIYVKQEHKSSLGLQLLVPLLKVIRLTKSTFVSTKACDLISNYSKLCKPNSVPQIPDTEAASSLLRTVHQQSSMEGSNAYNSACSRASLLLVKILVAQDRENLRLIESVYSQTHERFMLDKSSKIKPSFFSDWLNWSVTAR